MEAYYLWLLSHAELLLFLIDGASGVTATIWQLEHKVAFPQNEGWENELSVRHQISRFHWDVSSHVETAGSCQKEENADLSWATPGLHCCKMPFRSPGAEAKSGTAGEGSYLSIQPDHKQPQGRNQVFFLFCFLHPTGPGTGSGTCVLSTDRWWIKLRAEVVQETRTLAERVTILNVKMILKFSTQREESTFRWELGLSDNPQKILAVPI